VARSLLAGFVVAAVLAFGGHHIVIDAQTRSRNLPEFEVDKAWPKVPPKWKLGDASSFAIDSKDNVWLLHRPRTLKPGEWLRRRTISSRLNLSATPVIEALRRLEQEGLVEIVPLSVLPEADGCRRLYQRSPGVFQVPSPLLSEWDGGQGHGVG